MIPKDKELKLIAIYLFISDLYDNQLKHTCQRHSNNSEPEFTDPEILTIYLFVASEQQYFQLKRIHKFAKEYMSSWFPKLPSYATFNDRINRLSGAFLLLTQFLLSSVPENCDTDTSLLDSMPIITCKGKNRKGKVATEITAKGYCSTKNLYYYGLKLHILAFRRKGTIPFPEYAVITSAADNDLTIFKQELSESIYNRSIYADKAYSEKEFFSKKETENNYCMLTPVKLVKGEDETIRQRDRAYNDLFSRMVSSVRQPIESFFNWLIEKTDIQRASKVRSTAGLMVHVFGKMATAFLGLAL